VFARSHTLAAAYDVAYFTAAVVSGVDGPLNSLQRQLAQGVAAGLKICSYI
jgi:hypothetical protein